MTTTATRRGAVVILIAVLLLTSCAPNRISGAKMVEANGLYEAGRFAEAIATYEELIDQGASDEGLYYNLGNAYFQEDDIARAILNYRRALRLAPRDGDAVTNLQIARAQAVDQLALEGRDTALSVVGRWLSEQTTLDEVAIGALGMWVLLGVLLVVALLWRRGRRTMRVGIAIVTVLLILGILTMGIRVSDTKRNEPAVVVVAAVEVRSGPGEDYLVEFSLHAGAEVSVVEERNGWVRIALPGNLQGWVALSTVERL